MTNSVQSSDQLPEVSVIVVSFNTREMTLDCLRSIAEQTKSAHEVLLIDNASGDGTAAAVAAEFPGVRLMAEAENHGFARANNLAAKGARGEYILLLNPDTVVLDGAIDQLLAFAKREPQAKIWGGRTLYGDGSLNPTSCWGKMTLWSVFCTTTGLSSILQQSRLFNPEGYGNWQRDSARAVDIVTGAFLLMKRDLWNHLGGFDLSYVMYGEEADLCLRACAIGARPMITPEATIIHYVGASQQLRGSKLVMLLKAKIRLIRDHFPGWQKPPAMWMFRLWPLMRLWGTKARARLKGSSATRQDNILKLKEVWSRRAEWWNGWADI
ncbi:glycosyltransferase family 2 protein [Fuscibacter oryzae]|uniref:Glycosyltransferase family 2 protein n=1 Tax=Fuscibacter oryzae TaxID=2803939 RepID=A0A8J7MWG2_9RHOB|nr:glycosyltransferase family 2 protein [Fuscibacter oryzae]MBL4930100.1 glycosyltransferase family 2 protein [Fuscibacter oryzae]